MSCPCVACVQDVCDKLVVLMWKDWSPEVRDVAAEALGKLDKGKVRRQLLCTCMALYHILSFPPCLVPTRSPSIHSPPLQLVHDELHQRLQTPGERVRLDALKKIVALNLMTAQLLPSFLACFKDHHISVRVEAASVSVQSPLLPPPSPSLPSLPFLSSPPSL